MKKDRSQVIRREVHHKDPRVQGPNKELKDLEARKARQRRALRKMGKVKKLVLVIQDKRVRNKV